MSRPFKMVLSTSSSVSARHGNRYFGSIIYFSSLMEAWEAIPRWQGPLTITKSQVFGPTSPELNFRTEQKRWPHWHRDFSTMLSVQQETFQCFLFQGMGDEDPML